MLEKPLSVCLLQFVFCKTLVAYSDGFLKKQTKVRCDPRVWDLIEEHGKAGTLMDNKVMDNLFGHLPDPLLTEDLIFWGEVIKLRLEEETGHQFNKVRRAWVNCLGYQGEIYSQTSTSNSLIMGFCGRGSRIRHKGTWSL